MTDNSTNIDDSHKFLVEFKVSSPNRAEALKQLLLQLKSSDLDHYRLVTDHSVSASSEKARPSPPPPAKKAPVYSPDPNPLELRIRVFIESGKLIRLNINKGLGVKLSIPCRILNYDSDKRLITAYHVDEKQVYTVGLNEIDDFVE